MQQQYASRDLPSLLIRAARMEKPSLQAQLCYLLNMDSKERLSNYSNLAGNQDSPTFILLDGLNEANQPEAIWQEILEICRIFPDGRLKFIVSSRANTTVDVERYAMPENEELLVYGNKKEGEMGLRALTHWLTPLNMNEMKSAWEDYAQKDRNRFKPQFSFDDLATFDRGIYEQISNPLVLRLFLETYHGKALPKNKIGHLNIWQDWLATFSKGEQSFLSLLAEAVWEKGENELLLDELLKDEKLKPYFTTDLINAPYPRLKNNGWVSRYTKDLNAFVSFTVEGALLFLIGQKLAEQSPPLELKQIQTLLEEDNKFKKAAIEAFLCQQSLKGEFELVAGLIDAGLKTMQLCTTPMLLHLKSFGTKITLEKTLEHASENDWKALFELDKKLDELQLVFIRKEFLTQLMKVNSFQTKESILLGLKACQLLDKSEAETYSEKITETISLKGSDLELLYALGSEKKHAGKYNEAISLFRKCLELELESFGLEHPDVAQCYNNMGEVYFLNKENDGAMDMFQQSLNIRLKLFPRDHQDIATSYNNMGLALDNKGKHDEAVDYYLKSLDIRIKIFGTEHPDVAYTYNNLGVISCKKAEYDKALEILNKSLEIKLKTLGTEHLDLAYSYINIGYAWLKKKDFNQSLEYYQKSLNIRLKSLGTDHPDVAFSYNNIGAAWRDLGDYSQAIMNFEKSLDIRKKTLSKNHSDIANSYFNIGSAYKKLLNHEDAILFFGEGYEIEKSARFTYQLAMCHNESGNKDISLKFYIESAEIRKNNPTMGLEAVLTKKCIQEAKRLAMELGKLNDLPDWMNQ